MSRIRRILHPSDFSRASTAAFEAPVVSVYLDTRWADEHQRDRVRIFLKNELARARSGPAAPGDLDWVEREGEALVAQSRASDAHGVALFACEALGLHEVFSMGIPFENRFVVAAALFLRPLAALLRESPNTLVATSTRSARG